MNRRSGRWRSIRGRYGDRAGRQPMVASVDHGMIRPEGRSRRGPQMSATPDSTLANPEQLIADLQRQLAEREAELTECKAERDEALQRETATAEVLGVINSSLGDLTPVFDAMLERAIRLCESTYGHMFTYDGELFHLAAISGPPGYVEWSSQLGPVRSGPSAPLGRISHGERIVHVTDVQEEDVYHTSPGFREQADRRGVRSQITIALLKDDVLLGAMVVYRQEVRPFTDKQIALMQNFAAQ